MSRKLIIDGNAVYEIDENCMLKNVLTEMGKRAAGRMGEGNAGKDTQKKPTGTTDREPGTDKESGCTEDRAS